MKEKKTLLEKELTTTTKEISTLQESSKQMKAKLEEQRIASLHELSRKDDKIANLTQCIETQKHLKQNAQKMYQSGGWPL